MANKVKMVVLEERSVEREVEAELTDKAEALEKTKEELTEKAEALEKAKEELTIQAEDFEKAKVELLDDVADNYAVGFEDALLRLFANIRRWTLPPLRRRTTSLMGR